MVAMFLMDRDEMRNLNRGPAIDAFYQASIHLAKRLQRRIFKKNQPITNKNCLCRPCLLMDRDKMSNL
jgi:ADP-glucose pyrophosphorylase